MNKSNAHLEKSAGKMRRELNGVKRRIGEMRVAGHSNHGEIEVVVDGHHHVERITIDENWQGNSRALCDTLAEAFNDACDQIDDEYDHEMESLVSHYAHGDFD